MCRGTAAAVLPLLLKSLRKSWQALTRAADRVPTEHHKKGHTGQGRCALFCGGEGGIRTLERLLTVTRFPIVRARPNYATSPRLCSIERLYFLFANSLFIIIYKSRLVKSRNQDFDGNFQKIILPKRYDAWYNTFRTKLPVLIAAGFVRGTRKPHFIPVAACGRRAVTSVSKQFNFT